MTCRERDRHGGTDWHRARDEGEVRETLHAVVPNSSMFQASPYRGPGRRIAMIPSVPQWRPGPFDRRGSIAPIPSDSTVILWPRNTSWDRDVTLTFDRPPPRQRLASEPSRSAGHKRLSIDGAKPPWARQRGFALKAPAPLALRLCDAGSKNPSHSNHRLTLSTDKRALQSGYLAGSPGFRRAGRCAPTGRRGAAATRGAPPHRRPR